MTFTESDTVELKSQLISDICKEIIAFANSRGGTLYVDVEDSGNVIGLADTDQSTLQLSNMIRDSIKPDVTMFVRYETLCVEGKNIIAVTVQKGTDRPYYLGSKGLKPSGVYVRNGTSTDPATDTAIRRMIKETDGDSFETMRSLEQQLTFKAAEEQFKKRNVPFDAAKMQTLGMVSQDGIYSNVALLLSDQCSHTIKAAAFSGTDKTTFHLAVPCSSRWRKCTLISICGIRQKPHLKDYIAEIPVIILKKRSGKHCSILWFTEITLSVPVH